MVRAARLQSRLVAAAIVAALPAAGEGGLAVQCQAQAKADEGKAEQAIQ